MKKIYLFLGLICIPFMGKAQHLLDSIQNNIEDKLQHVDINTVNTGIFYDRIYKKANVDTYYKPVTPTFGGGFQPINPPPTIRPELLREPSNYMHYFMAHDDLERADFQNRYDGTDALFQLNQNSGSNVNIGVINTDITVFNGDPIQLGTLNVVGVDSLLYKNNFSPNPLYKDLKNCLIASPLKKLSTSRRVNFRINTSFWKETAEHTISTLEIDFNDGNGFRTVTQGQNIRINYSDTGIKELKFKATFSDSTTHEVEANFEVIDAPSIGMLDDNTTQEVNNTNTSCSLPLSATFFSSLTFQGYDETQPYSALGRYRNHSNTSCVDKPVIVVEGYDPSDSFENNDIFLQLNNNLLGTQLISTGHDIFTLDFRNYETSNGKLIRGGSDYIERNAMLLIELINRINANKSPSAEPIKVIGFSMGGLVARYALSYMEANNMAHDTDLYVSVDAPHQGAVVPMGAQYTVDFIDDLVPSWADEELSSLTDDLFLPAPKQMLVHHFGSSTEFPDGFIGFHNTFYNNLNTLGYPQQTRNIAVVNGRLDGNGTNSINERFYEGKLHLYGIFLNGKLRLNLTNQSSRARVFYWRLKFLIFNVWKRERHANSYASLGSYENSPGGIASVDDLDERITQFSSFGFDAFVTGVKQELNTDAFSFLPTKSGLDFVGNPFLFEDISNINLGCNNNTPFDTYYAPNVNEPHLFLSTNASNFIRQEILGNIQEPNFTLRDSDLKQDGADFLCGNNGNSVRFYFDQCKTKQGVTWSISNPSLINIIQQDNTQFEFSAVNNATGSVTITANIPNQTNISRTIDLGTYFDFPSNSYYQVYANGNSTTGSLVQGFNDLIPTPTTNLDIPYGAFAVQNLPTSWQNLNWQLISDPQNAVFTWNEISNNLNFSYHGNKHNATIVFRLYARTNCGEDYNLTYWFKIPEPDGNLGGGFALKYTAYPIPANQNLNIETKNNYDGKPRDIEIFDMNGQSVYNGKISNNLQNIDTSHLREGLYIIKIWHEGKILTERISIKH